MPKAIDWTTRRIGRVNIMSLHSRGNGASKWNCVCDCGNNFIALAVSFKNGKKFECKKCVFKRRRTEDLTGRQFGRWTVLKMDVNEKNKTICICKCDCGAIGKVAPCLLGKKGKSNSCGCLGRKQKSIWVNDTLYPPIHGKSRTKLYATRIRIIHSCYNEKHISYFQYGAEGYTVCELWKNSALDFFNWCVEKGWEEKKVISIKDGCKEYNPENCFIIPEIEYRKSLLAKQLEYNGVTKSVLEWSEERGMKFLTLLRRLRRHPPHEALFLKLHEFSGFKNRKLDPEIKRLYLEENKSCADIGRILGFNYATVSRRLKKMGVKVDDGCERRNNEFQINNFGDKCVWKQK